LLFLLYLYTRVPDYFDGETITAIVKFDKKTNVSSASYTIATKQYTINADYPLRQLKEGESVELIYNPSKPEIAAVYSLWGYWFTWGELIMSVVLLLGLYKLATSITQNPAEDTLTEQAQMLDTPQRKYI